MRISITHLTLATAVSVAIALAGAPAWAKTVKECDAEYAANKAAIKSSGEKKKDFVAACRAGAETIPAGAATEPAAAPAAEAPAASGGVKTAKECDAEYKANKEAIKASGEKKKDFVAACRAGNETIPSGAAPAPAAAPPDAPAAPAAESGGKTEKECNAEYKANKEAIKASGQRKKDFVAACRAGTATIPTGGAPAAPPPGAAPTPAPSAPAEQAPSEAPAAAPSPSAGTSAPEPVSASEAQAQASCPGGTVVWVNTRSHIYHFKGTHNYGTTKHGAYMCETAAKAAGDRAAENEKHP